jgi:integrase
MGDWTVFVHHNGKRTKKQFSGDKRAAERFATELRRALAAGDFHLPTVGPAFKDVVDDWLKHYPTVSGVRLGTFENHRSFVEQHLIPHFGSQPITALTPSALEDFIALKLGPKGSTRFSGKPLLRSSLRTGLMALRLILRHATTRGHIAVNPMDRVRLKRPTDDGASPDPFSGDELRRIEAAAEQLDQDFATLLWLWGQTGMREGEVCALQAQDFDLERGTAVVRRSWSRGRIGPTKTGLVRTVTLTHPVLDETPEWRPGATPGSLSVLGRLRQLKERTAGPSAFVFSRGTNPIPTWDLSERWHRVLVTAKVRYRSPEQLRHTFASTMLSRNAPLLYVQKQGGWRSAAVLLRVYAQWLPQEHLFAPPARLAIGADSLSGPDSNGFLNGLVPA